MINFTGYILSGGKSSRMGKDKSFLKFGEKTFLQIAADALEPNCRQVKIALNRGQNHFVERLPANISPIFDKFENRGASGGIHAALKDCETEFAVILAVDLPLVTDSAISKLCKIALDSVDVSAIVPRQTDGKLQPLCAVYRAKDCVGILEEFLRTENSVSARKFLQKINVRIVGIENLSAEENLFANINSPEDFKNVSGANR